MASLLYGTADYPQRDPRDVRSTVGMVDDTEAVLEHAPEPMGAAFDRDEENAGGLTSSDLASYVPVIDREYTYPSPDLATGTYGQDVSARQSRVGSFLNRLGRRGSPRLVTPIGVEPAPLEQYGDVFFEASKRQAQDGVTAQLEPAAIPADSAREQASAFARQDRGARAAAYRAFFGTVSP